MKRATPAVKAALPQTSDWTSGMGDFGWYSPALSHRLVITQIHCDLARLTFPADCIHLDTENIYFQHEGSCFRTN